MSTKRLKSSGHKDRTRAEFEEAAKRKKNKIVFESMSAETSNNWVRHVYGTVQIGDLPKRALWDRNGHCWFNGNRRPEYDLFED